MEISIIFNVAMILKPCRILSPFGCLIMFDLDLMILMVPWEFEHFEMWHGFQCSYFTCHCGHLMKSFVKHSSNKIAGGTFPPSCPPPRAPQHNRTTSNECTKCSVRSTLRPLTVQLPHRHQASSSSMTHT